MPAPSVLDHADFRRYLDEWFTARKEKNARFSHRAFARKVGSSDPSVLLNIVRGRRRLPPENLDAFVTALGLTGPEAEYFCELVRFGQAAERQERERAFAGLTALRSRLSKPEIDSSQFLYLSDPIYPAIHELAQCVGFQADPDWIGAYLRPRVSRETAAEALALLTRFGFLTPDGKAAKPVLHTSERVAALGSYGYHRVGLDAAIDALEALHGPAPKAVAESTAFLGITIAVPAERLNDVRRLMWQAQLSVLHQVEAWDGPRDQVVQLSQQMVPVSERTD